MQTLQEVVIDKLVHGGQGLGTLPDGRKVFVWNALPGETVRVRLTKQRKDYAEAMAEEVVVPSVERVQPRDEAYLSTSPWQIMDFAAENRHKKTILLESFAREGVPLPDFDFVTAGSEWQYRNKMEYSFWADDDGLHLALFHRASHGKRIIQGSSIARPEIDSTAQQILGILQKHGIRGSQLKTVVLRVSTAGQVVAALFVKDKEFPEIAELQNVCQGVGVYYSNPKSPASVLTQELYVYGNLVLTDKILGVDVSYDVHSFFQVNLPVFEVALKRIDYFTGGSANKIDMYSGVGTIGLPIGGTKVLVESDARNIAMAGKNAAGHDIQVVHASSEKALDYITPDACIIVDPPRAGLHADVVQRLLDIKPAQIAYLSCNPSTQARDVALLQQAYKIHACEGYNFFPRTPHIESLVILERI